MTLDQLIKQLQDAKKEHGGDLRLEIGVVSHGRHGDYVTLASADELAQLDGPYEYRGQDWIALDFIFIGNS